MKDPAIPFLLVAIYSKKPKILNQQDTGMPEFIATLFTIAMIWKQTKCPSIDELIKKWYIDIMQYK